MKHTKMPLFAQVQINAWSKISLRSSFDHDGCQASEVCGQGAGETAVTVASASWGFQLEGFHGNIQSIVVAVFVGSPSF